MGYLILLGGVLLAAMLGLKVGELAGKLTDSTVVASLTSCLLYSGLLFAAGSLRHPTPKLSVSRSVTRRKVASSAASGRGCACWNRRFGNSMRTVGNWSPLRSPAFSFSMVARS